MPFKYFTLRWRKMWNYQFVDYDEDPRPRFNQQMNQAFLRFYVQRTGSGEVSISCVSSCGGTTCCGSGASCAGIGEARVDVNVVGVDVIVDDVVVVADGVLVDFGVVSSCCFKELLLSCGSANQ
jgi:hypothetical protein